MALEEENDKSLLSVKDQDDEEKLVIKIATISLVLRRLGFQTGQINQCLKSVRELELEAAINWVSPATYKTTSIDGGVEANDFIIRADVSTFRTYVEQW